MEERDEDEIQTEPDLLPPRIIEGKDELNLAEFPLSAISDRPNPDQKTLVFEDRIFDVSRGEMVARKLTITASDQFGLPTAHDDEVILGLIQLSKLRQFKSREVHFTRYHLIRLLGWRDEGKSYDRLEKSLNRWLGVTLYYDNAWWSKTDKCFVNEKFHILDNVRLFDKDQRRKSAGSSQPSLPLSSFTWNEVIFRSFLAGNLKGIDFDFLKTLDSSVAKRLYRFLDKRFYHRAHWELNLQDVAWEKIGLSRNYDTAQIKRRLLPAIRELEERGFLRAMPEAERFVKISSGEWQVIFEHSKAASPARAEIPTHEAQVLVQALLDRGVTLSTAQQTVSSCTAERIKAQLEVFDWLLSINDRKVSRNPAGFLVASIRNEYTAPKGFVSAEERAKKESLAQERKRKDEARLEALATREADMKRQREQAIAKFWELLSESERTRLEAEALAQANSLQRDILERGGTFASATRQSLFDALALNFLAQGS